MTRVTRAAALTLCSMTFGAMIGSAAQIDSKAVEFITPENIKWVRNAAGTNETAVLFGDPEKPGSRDPPALVAGQHEPAALSPERPVFRRDLWDLVAGTGEKFDPDSTVPAPAGSYVIHKAKQVHYDGAKKEPAVIQVWGMGPATSHPAEKK